jgi:fucose permease
VAEVDKGLDQQTVGLVMSFWYIGYAIFAISMDHILLYTGRKNAIILGLILLSLDFSLAAL